MLVMQLARAPNMGKRAGKLNPGTHLLYRSNRWMFTRCSFSTGTEPSSNNGKDLAAKSQPVYAALCITRPPLVSRSLEPFEDQFYRYHRRLAALRSAPFVGQFFFKPGSLAEIAWSQAKSANSQAKTRRSGQMVQPTEVALSAELEQARDTARQLASGRTDNGRPNDVQSLERKLDKSLYLVVKQKLHSKLSQENPGWVLPYMEVEELAGLDTVVNPILDELLGSALNYWLVSPTPFAHTLSDDAAKFYLKVKVFAGMIKKTRSVLDFAWLTKDELSNYLSKIELEALSDILLER